MRRRRAPPAPIAQPVPVIAQRLRNPRWGMVAVALAGPGMNLALATLTAIAIGIIGATAGGTAPVGSYPANGYGAFDLIGNVWEWTTDFYAPRHLRLSDQPVDAGRRENLLASASAEPGFTTPRRVLKGGSQLCAMEYCVRFRPAARSPQAEDTGMSHIGFRCARDV